MLTLKGLKQAEKFVEKQQAAGNDVRWDGWTMVFFRGKADKAEETEHAMWSPEGALRNGVWGFENRVEVDSNGVWKVDYRNVRRIKRARD